jgi:16S rRNA G966 N2-methylase RsmD
MEVPKLTETPVDSDLYKIIIEDGFITIPRTNLVEIAKDETKIKKLSDDIHHKILEGTIPFPFVKNYKINNPIQLYRNLKVYKPQINTKTKDFRAVVWTDPTFKKDKYRDRHYSFENKEGDYDNIDILVDYFNEEVRMKGKLNHEQYSPLDAWKNKDFLHKIIKQFLDTNKTDNLTSFALRELVWASKLECNSFKATLASSVYWHFNAKRILDISSGWGDRLLGAMAHYADRYLGFDPNIDLQHGYNAMKDMFLKDEFKSAFEVRPTQFEEADLQGETFDLIFTSPPYYDFEVYVEGDITQSMERYNSLDTWLVGFLFTSLKKAWNVLDQGGNMVIHINDPNYPKHISESNRHRFVEAMILFVGGWCEGSIFDGAIGSIGETGQDRRSPKPRPMWVFYNDIKYVSKGYNERCRAVLKKNYNNLYELVIKKFG